MNPIIVGLNLGIAEFQFLGAIGIFPLYDETVARLSMLTATLYAIGFIYYYVKATAHD